MIRKTIFWTHLVVGVAVSLVVVMMSATGVLLTYEHQIQDWAEKRNYWQDEQPEGERLPVDELVAQVGKQEPSFRPVSVMINRDPLAPVEFSAGRERRLVDAYTGEVLGTGSTGAEEFFRTMTAWHRWFAAEGDKREIGRAVTGASNLAFLFLILSGLYLWLPPVYNRVAFRTRLLFNPKARTAKARDYNWHHVFGFWIAIPLAVVVATGVVFSYSWANDLVFRIVGEEPPVRRGPPGPGGPGDRGGAPDAPVAEQVAFAEPALPLEDVVLLVSGTEENWDEMSIDIPDAAIRRVRVTLRQRGDDPRAGHSIEVDRSTGEIAEVAAGGEATRSLGMRIRGLIRFLHTGEALGVVGQTVAGTVTLLSLLMVWTGLTLAWRRLISPLFRKKSPA